MQEKLVELNLAIIYLATFKIVQKAFFFYVIVLF